MESPRSALPGGGGRPAIARPANFDQMLAIASQLSTGFDFVRVDFYNVEGRIHFGELTFTPMAGYLKLRRRAGT